MALSLMTGEYRPHDPSPNGSPDRTLDHPRAAAALSQPRETATGRLSDTFSLSSSSAVLPQASDKRGQKTSYWHSVAQIGVQVAGALEHAHRQKILHRDIKPSNLLLDTHGVVWVTDFGLAKVDDQQNLTHTGDVLGTLRYMPPEAFEGKSDSRSDVYSLGLTLYELVALRPAFDETDRHKLIKQVATEEPVRLDRINPAAPRDLVTIIHKAIDRDAGRRYQTAEALQADLQRFLADEPIQARRTSPAERFLRWARRNRSLATALSVIALLLLVVAVGSALAAGYFQNLAGEKADLADREKDARADAEGKRKEAESLAESEKKARKLTEVREKEARWHLYKAQMFPMMEAWRERDFGRLEQLLEETTPKKGEPDFRGWEWYYFQDQVRQASRLLKGSDPYRGIADLCRKTGKIAVQTQTGAIDIWDPTGTKVECTLPAKTPFDLMVWSPQGDRLAVLNGQGDFLIWEVKSSQSIRLPKTTYTLNIALAWSPDGSKLASGGEPSEHISIWDARTGRLLTSLSTPAADVYASSLDWSPDGIHLAAGLRWGRCGVWDTASGQQRFIRSVSGTVPILAVTWSPDGKKLAAGGVGITICDDQGRELFTGLNHGPRVKTLTWSPDGRTLLSGSEDQSIKLWDGGTGQGVRKLHLHHSIVRNVDWSPDGKRLVSIGEAGDLRVSLSDKLSEKASQFILRGPVSELAWSPNGHWLGVTTGAGVTVGTAGNNAILDVRSGEVQRKLRLKRPWSSMAWSPDSSQLATLDYDYPGMVVFWDTKSGQPLRTLRTSDQRLGHNHDIDWSSDSKWLATNNATHSTKHGLLWNTATWHPFANPPSFPGGYRCAFSPNSLVLATCSETQLSFWEVATGKLIRRVSQGSMHALGWSPDGQFVSLASRDGSFVVVRFANGQIIQRVPAHKGPVLRVSWSPDGRRIATGSHDGVIKIWDVATLDHLITLPCEGGGVGGLHWSPDSKRLAAGFDNGTVFLFGSPDIGAAPEKADHLETGFLALANTSPAALTPDEKPSSQPPAPGPPEVKTPLTLTDELNDPEGPIALVDLAHVHLAGKNLPAAEKRMNQGKAQLDRLAAKYPGDPGLRIGQIYWLRVQSEMAMASGHYEEAETHLDRLMKLYPSNHWLYYALYKAQYLQGKLKAADKTLERADARFGTNPTALNDLGWWLVTDPDLPVENASAALALAKKAVQLRPDGTYWNTLGVAHYKAGQYQEAITALEKSFSLQNGDEVYGRLFLALAHDKLGHPEQAQKYFRQAVEWMDRNRPENEELLRFRAEAETTLKKKAAPPGSQETP
jgi:WD40 repeat protein/tetratricopeptide (TPR) repeat protein